MVSIIVPIYKVEKYINKCIDSILNQKLKDFELILVDDGSPDNCGKICDEYSKKDNRIKVVHKKNGGLVSARQAGFKVSTGEYIGFVDGDDYIEENMFFDMMEKAKEYNADMVLCDFFHLYPDKKVKSKQYFEGGFYDKKSLEKYIYPKMIFSGSYYSFGFTPSCWSKIFKREVLENNIMKVDTRIKMGEDAAFTYPCMLDSNNIYFIKNKYLYNYRINPKSMTQSYDKNLWNIILLPYYRLKEKSFESDFDISFQLSYYLLYLINFVIRNEAKAGKIKSLKDKIKIIKEILYNDDILNAIKEVDLNILPNHTKTIVKFIRKKSVLGLYIYINMFSIFLRIKR